jgi:hypothetical protein
MARRWQEDWAAGSTAVAKTSSSDDYVRFDEIKDVLASVDLIALLAPLVGEKPLHWKWMIVGAHDALQGAMVCAFADSTETSILEQRRYLVGSTPVRTHGASIPTNDLHPLVSY